ncbi:MAG TPA: hypothetical protein PL131_09450 [Methylotenera sp.]|nr:hypothetical protein [Methylotenera sp.]HPH06088.1 hypothetical protein [Methylotenera sp.]
MLNSLKIYLAFCLIGLQLIGPFIHAHAFGLDSLNERAVHIHSHIATAQSTSNMLMDTSTEQAIGYVVTVANGIVPQNMDDLMLSPILGIAIFFSFALLLMSQQTHISYPPLKPLFRKRLSYNHPSPRAPPR